MGINLLQLGTYDDECFEFSIHNQPPTSALAKPTPNNYGGLVLQNTSQILELAIKLPRDY